MQPYGGVSRYYAQLFTYFPAEVRWELAVAYTGNEHLSHVPGLQGRIRPYPDYYAQFLKGMRFKGKRRLFQLAQRLRPSPDLSDFNRRLTIAKLKEGNFDVFHPTYYDDYFLEYLGDKPFVLTVYDMIHEIFPEHLLHDRAPRIEKKLLQQAAGVLAISENTKKDLITFWGIPAGKIRVTPLAGEVYPGGAAALPGGRLPVPASYILYVGQRSGYKNFYFFLQAVVELLRAHPGLGIVCTGSPFTKDEKRFFSRLGVTDRLVHAGAGDREMPFLYGKAVCLVYASLYEGFGMPVLEAMMHGCPVVSSDAASLPEVGGDAVLYVNPKDPAGFRAALGSMLNEPALREKLVRAGLSQARRFSWPATSAGTTQFYREVLSNR
jgi:glycosyltransferase involved in cell wall biosynthesis